MTPRPIASLHQIEITSRCSLACPYCINPNLKRPHEDISRDHFLAALRMVKHYVDRGTQRELNLAGTGESTLHRDFAEYVLMAREVIDNIIYATNGCIADEAMIRTIAPAKPRVWVTLHEPAYAMRAIALYRKYGILEGVSVDPFVNPNSWAGQVAWADPRHHKIPCPWLGLGRAMVTSAGKIVTCCLDPGHNSEIGDLATDPTALQSRRWKLCDTCHQTIEGEK